jgi:threonine synthase
MREVFVGAGVSEAETSRAIVSTLNQSGELVDPHTAVGLAAAYRLGLGRGGAPLVVLSTAHAAKFPEAVTAAAGVAPVLPRSAQGLAGKPERIHRLPADVAAVQTYIREFAQV